MRNTECGKSATGKVRNIRYGMFLSPDFTRGSTNYRTDVRRRMEAYGGVWSLMEAYGAVWMLMGAYGNVWKRIEAESRRPMEADGGVDRHYNQA